MEALGRGHLPRGHSPDPQLGGVLWEQMNNGNGAWREGSGLVPSRVYVMTLRM